MIDLRSRVVDLPAAVKNAAVGEIIEMRNLLAALCASTILYAAPVSAATLIQTARSTNGPAYVNRLDPSIGTLNRVTVSSSYFYNVYFNYPSRAGAPVITATGRLGANELGLYDFSGSYQSVNEDPLTIGIRLAGSAVATTTSNFSPFAGTGLVFLGGFLSADSSFKVDGIELTKASASFPGGAGGDFIVTYDFTPAIPEPATWALMLAGFGMVGYTMRRRRARVVYA